MWTTQAKEPAHTVLPTPLLLEDISCRKDSSKHVITFNNTTRVNCKTELSCRRLGVAHSAESRNGCEAPLVSHRSLFAHKPQGIAAQSSKIVHSCVVVQMLIFALIVRRATASDSRSSNDTSTLLARAHNPASTSCSSTTPLLHVFELIKSRRKEHPLTPQASIATEICTSSV